MPLRRYLRVSKSTTLELRVHVVGQDRGWFSDSTLKAAIQLVKPHILPKLQEEKRTKQKKKGPTKDVVEGGTTNAD